MKNLSLLCFILLINTSAFAQQSITFADASDCNQKFFQALLDEDVSAMGPLLTNDFTIVSFDGQLVDGNMLLDGMSKGILVVESGQVSNTNIRVYGEAGVVTGTWRVRGKIDGNMYSTEVAYLLVCVRQGGGWKVAAAQFTPLP